MTLDNLFQTLLDTLKSTRSENALRDPKYIARVIISDICGIDRASQLAHPDQHITHNLADKALDAAKRHAGGEPLSRIRGTGCFYDLDFDLSPDTLDPRPETEIIVRMVLQHIRPPSGGWNFTGLFDKNISTQSISLLDLGTGTGCIPISILKHAPHLHATAIDISDAALHTAHQNAIKHEVDGRLTLIRSNWYDSIPQQSFDIITSNPPYIPTKDIPNLDHNVKNYDPIRALDGGVTGLDPYKILIAGLDTYLTPNGIALFEIGIGQAPDIMRLGEKYGLDVHPPIVDDAHIPRVICITRPVKK